MKTKSAAAPKPRRNPPKRKPQARGERVVARRGDTTRLSILDAAERSFAESGFDGVSLRTITERAGVDLALANYHFGTKENLLHEVIARRARIVHDERVKELELARQQAGTQSPSVEAIVSAFLAPMFRRLADGDAGWRHYAKSRVAARRVAEIHRAGERSARSHGTALHQRVAARHAESAGTVSLLGLHVSARHDGAGDIGHRADRAIVARAVPLRRRRRGTARDRSLCQWRFARLGIAVSIGMFARRRLVQKRVAPE